MIVRTKTKATGGLTADDESDVGLQEVSRALQATTIPPKEALDDWRPTVSKFCSTCRWDKLSEPPCENCSVSSNWEAKTP